MHRRPRHARGAAAGRRAAAPALIALAVLVAVALPGSPASARKGGPGDKPAAAGHRQVQADDLAAVGWRAIGPANMSGRVSAVALVPGSRTEFYVGFATGGVFKTANLGTTFSEVFRHEAIARCRRNRPGRSGRPARPSCRRTAPR